jgi:hypothetical protein
MEPLVVSRAEFEAIKRHADVVIGDAFGKDRPAVMSIDLAGPTVIGGLVLEIVETQEEADRRRMEWAAEHYFSPEATLRALDEAAFAGWAFAMNTPADPPATMDEDDDLPKPDHVIEGHDGAS